MPNLAELTESQVVKLLLIGNSKSGKTGSLASLVKAGYKLRIMDYDNGWESLAAAVQKTCPDLLSTVSIEPLRDRMKSSPIGPIMDGPPKAFAKGLSLLDKWTDGTKPGDWGPEYVLVIDSLTLFSDSAYNWADAMNPGAKDKRQIYGVAQKAVEHALSMLTNDDFKTNVVVICHIKYLDLPDGTKKGFPQAVGSALSPDIPIYFNSYAQCESAGGKRTIRTDSSALIDLANPKSFEMGKSLPIETGLATFFEVLRGPLAQGESTDPAPITKLTPTPISNPIKLKRI